MDLDTSFGFQLNRAARAIAGHLAASLPPLGVTTAQWVVLQYVSGNPGVHQERIAADLGTDAATLAGILGRLEGRGLVERRPDPTDRRRRLVHPTTDAAPVAAQGAALATATNEAALAGFTAAERTQLRDYLHRALANLGSTP